MYTFIWSKYLSVFRILVKRAAKEEQVLHLNIADFEKMASARKSGFSFTIIFKQAKVMNGSSLPAPAKDLATLLLEDAVVNEQFQKGEYHVSLSRKMALKIHLIQPATEGPESPQLSAMAQ